MSAKALIVVDIQNDFLPGGALAVPQGNRVIPIVNDLMNRFDPVVATQDWHPPDHGSFAANHPGKKIGQRIDLHGLDQILWPVHCVQETIGADFAPSLNQARFARIFRKGTDAEIDSYSGFFDNGHRRPTGLAEFLAQKEVRDLYICGLATDYCVKFTALDAIGLGFRTNLLLDACRGVNLHDGDVDAALAEMASAGVVIANSAGENPI
jgi:nicotinamidase/pyrazinamidase